jgi:hypothetical protein
MHASSLQSLFSIHQHTPAFMASSSFSRDRCFKVFSGVFQHCIVKCPRLQPDRGDPDRMSLLKQRQRYRRRSDNRQRGLRGRRQSAGRRHRRVRFGGEIDLWCSRVQGSDGQRVLMIPSKDYQYHVSDSRIDLKTLIDCIAVCHLSSLITHSCSRTCSYHCWLQQLQSAGRKRIV